MRTVSLFLYLVLFSNLDDIANKGLVKGLIKLCHIQDKKIKNFDASVSKMKSQIKTELAQKEKVIRLLNEELNNLRGSLKGCIYLLFIKYLVIGENYENDPNMSINSGRGSFPKAQNLNKSYRSGDKKGVLSGLK
jgi:hypothetical protein